MFFFLVIAALAATAAASPAGPIFPNGRIVGGENAQIETYPWQVSVQAYGMPFCGGSIISANYVLTAGFCASSSNSPMLSVLVGSSSKFYGGTVHEVEKVIRHEKFSINRYGVPLNDISILRLKKPIVFDETRQPINLFNQDEESAPGVSSVVTGWGNNGYGSPEQLQAVSVPIISKELCNKAYLKTHGGLPEGQICAAYYGVGGKDACTGDSGGPLTIDGRLAGIVSWGNGCAQAYYPGVYTEVAAYRDWIDKNAEL